MKNLVFRVDAGNRIGAGHLMRCLALAQAWQDTAGQAIFVTACRNEGLLQRLKEEGFTVHLLPETNPDIDNDWGKTKEIIADYDIDWLVLDGYHFNENYQQQIKKEGYKLLVIDDMAQLKYYYADVILNQNLHAGQLHYSCQPDTRLLLGSEYVLLRREFLNYKGHQRSMPPAAKNLLITMGGSDPNNVSLKVVQSLEESGIPDIEVTVVIGASNPHASILEEAVKGNHLSLRLIRNAGNIPQLMAEADMAISAAGSTVWELAFMGVPSVIAATTPVEEYLTQGLYDHGLFTSLNWINGFPESELINILSKLITDREARHNMSLLGRSLIDGEGCGRVIRAIIGSEKNNE